VDSLEKAVEEILTFLTSEKDCKIRAQLGRHWDTDRIESTNDVERTERGLFSRVEFSRRPKEGAGET